MATLGMMFPARGGLGSDEGVLSEVRGIYSPQEVCITYWLSEHRTGDRTRIVSITVKFRISL